MARMRVAMVAPSVSFPDTLGQTTHQWALAKGLADRGVQVHLYCRRPKGLPELEAGVTFHRVFSAQFPGQRPFFTASCKRRLARDQKRQPYELIHDRGYLFGGAGGVVGQAAGVPVVLQIDDNWPLSEAQAASLAGRGFYQQAALRSCRAMLERATSGFAVSATLKGQARAWHPKADQKLVVLPNGAHLDRFHPGVPPLGVRERLGLPPQTRLAVFIGAMGPWHGTDQLPEVARELAKLEAHVIVAGGGRERWAKAQDEAGTRPENLHLMGRLPSEEVPALLTDCQMGLCPYPDRDFGFSPLKVFEYFACGLPVVASKLPSTEEVIQQERTGLLAPPGDGRALGQAAARILQEPALALTLREGGLAAARTTYNWDKLVERLLQLYERTLAGEFRG